MLECEPLEGDVITRLLAIIYPIAKVMWLLERNKVNFGYRIMALHAWMNVWSAYGLTCEHSTLHLQRGTEC